MLASDLTQGIRAGKRGALARSMSLIENGDPRASEILKELRGELGRARRTGLTGPPGAGKSTLTDALACHWSQKGRSVGLLAVDPSSPFSGGALLGDRIRMDRSSGDYGVFVRSMATRGSLGGLALAAGAAADLMDVFGFTEILLETVGVGQAEIDVAAATDITVVVLNPQSGDSVQAMKAGLMEAGDVFVVNKSDLVGADAMVHDLEQSLELRPEGTHRPPVLRCSALQSEGIAELADAIETLSAQAMADGRWEQGRQERDLARVQRVFHQQLRKTLWGDASLLETARQLLAQGMHPDQAAVELLASVQPNPLESNHDA